MTAKYGEVFSSALVLAAICTGLLIFNKETCRMHNNYVGQIKKVFLVIILNS